VAVVRDLNVEGDPSREMLHADPHSMSSIMLV
jgi:hypothetical protein